MALVKLPKPLTYSNTIKPVCLASSAQNTEAGKCIISGWGALASGIYIY